MKMNTLSKIAWGVFATSALLGVGCQTQMPITVRETVVGKDSPAQDGKGNPLSPDVKNRFETPVPSRILELVERDSKEKVRPIEVCFGNSYADKLGLPTLNGTTSAKIQEFDANGKPTGRLSEDYEYEISAHSSEPTPTGSNNNLTLHLRAGKAEYDIKAFATIHRTGKTGGEFHFDQMAGEVVWTGPIRVK